MEIIEQVLHQIKINTISYLWLQEIIEEVNKTLHVTSLSQCVDGGQIWWTTLHQNYHNKNCNAIARRHLQGINWTY